MLASLAAVLALTLSAPPPTQDPTTPTCRPMDGQVSCGYACKSDGMKVRCAQTPQGTCRIVDGQAVCFDPPAYVVKVYGTSLPEAECKAIDGVVACGYNCATQGGKVKCARTPAGMCVGRGGEVRCFDPPAAVFAVYGKTTPRMECRTNDLVVACGYGCVTGPDGVRCARTPLGVCKTTAGRSTCFDPTPAAMCAWKRSLPAPECRNGEAGPVCGYACGTAFSRVGCASTPAGICKVVYGEVSCFDPPAEQQADAECLALIGLAAMDGAAP